jgi:signal peptidase II
MVRPFAYTLRSPAALARFFLTMAIGLGLDLWTKSMAETNLQGRDPLVMIPGWLQFEFLRNGGAVFGIAQGQRTWFLLISAAAVVFLTYLFANSQKRPFYQIILGMLLAGVLGNMYDRVVLSSVRDMIHVLPGWHWPSGIRHLLHLPDEVFPYIFNIADSLLCVGVALMLIYSFFNSPHEPSPRPQGAKIVQA